MRQLKTLFRRGPSAAALEEIAKRFDAGKQEVVRILLDGLSDRELSERQHCAVIIRSRIMPSLERDLNPASKVQSLRTLEALATVLRVPQNDQEMSDLDNAAFYYMQERIEQNS